jgi:hypothetical protein
MYGTVPLVHTSSVQIDRQMYSLFSDHEDLEYECLGCRGNKSYTEVFEQFSTKLNDVALDKLLSLLTAIIKHPKSYIMHHLSPAPAHSTTTDLQTDCPPVPQPTLCLYDIEQNLKRGDYVSVSQVIGDLEQVRV